MADLGRRGPWCGSGNIIPMPSSGLLITSFGTAVRPVLLSMGDTNVSETATYEAFIVVTLGLHPKVLLIIFFQ